MAKRLVRYRRENGALVKIAELPMLENGKVDISWLPVVGTSGAAIISEGSNANGSWVRFANGTQICQTADVFVGSMPGVIKTITYPAAFASTPHVVPTLDIYQENTNTTLASGFAYATKPGTVGKSGCQISVISLGGVPLTNGSAKLIIIGRWK